MKATRLDERLCCVKGCDTKHYGKGLCQAHYSRMVQGYPIVGYREYHGKDIVCENGICRVPLTKKLHAIIEEADAEEIGNYTWTASTSTKSEYALRKGRKGEPKTVHMHRIIARAKPGEIVDHINRNTLDNRRSNLRLCTAAQNVINRGYSKPGKTSKFRGVSWNKKDRKWVAQIGAKGGHIRLGYFKDEVEAAKAYDKAAVELHESFACLNFPIAA